MKESFAALLLLPVIVAGAWLAFPAMHTPDHKAAPVTFTKTIAPILFDHCASCHRPGEAAPFSLLTYEDAHNRGRQIEELTASHAMPPWKAVPIDCAFREENRLSDAQIASIRSWVSGGMPEGSAQDMPKMPHFTEGWQLGKPDLIVKMARAFTIPAEGADIYRNFVLPLNLSEDTWVSAIEFRPGARSVVHHTLIFYDATGNSRKRDGEDGQPGFGGGMGGILGGGSRGGGGGLRSIFGGESSGTPTVGSLGGWAVGTNAAMLPDDLAYKIPKGADLILSTHFHPTGRSESEQSTVGLYFAKKAPTQQFTSIQLPPLFGVFSRINIPAGDKDYSIEDEYTLPVDVKAFGVTAHAHYLGKEMKLTAALPNGKTETLLWIPDWDFNYQGQYYYKNDVPLPKGTKLSARISYDNSSSNPRNPTSPPKNVRWGEQTTDEMGSVILRLVAASESDLPILDQDYRNHVRAKMMSAFGGSGPQTLARKPQ